MKNYRKLATELLLNLYRGEYMFSIFIFDSTYSVPSKVRNSREFPPNQVHGTIVKTNNRRTILLTCRPWRMENWTTATAASESVMIINGYSFKEDVVRNPKVRGKVMENALKQLLTLPRRHWKRKKPVRCKEWSKYQIKYNMHCSKSSKFNYFPNVNSWCCCRRHSRLHQLSTRWNRLQRLFNGRMGSSAKLKEEYKKKAWVLQKFKEAAAAAAATATKTTSMATMREQPLLNTTHNLYKIYKATHTKTLTCDGNYIKNIKKEWKQQWNPMVKLILPKRDGGGASTGKVNCTGKLVVGFGCDSTAWRVPRDKESWNDKTRGAKRLSVENVLGSTSFTPLNFGPKRMNLVHDGWSRNLS